MDKRTPTHGLGPSNILTEPEVLDRLGLGAREGRRWLQAHGLNHDVLGQDRVIAGDLAAAISQDGGVVRPIPARAVAAVWRLPLSKRV